MRFAALAESAPRLQPAVCLVAEDSRPQGTQSLPGKELGEDTDTRAQRQPGPARPPDSTEMKSVYDTAQSKQVGRHYSVRNVAAG